MRACYWHQATFLSYPLLSNLTVHILPVTSVHSKKNEVLNFRPTWGRQDVLRQRVLYRELTVIKESTLAEANVVISQRSLRTIVHWFDSDHYRSLIRILISPSALAVEFLAPTFRPGLLWSFSRNINSSLQEIRAILVEKSELKARRLVLRER